MKHITIIQGHPDSEENHLCHGLADSYKEGAVSAGHQLTTITVAELEFPLLRSRDDFVNGERPACIIGAQREFKNADHLLLVYPLWLGTLPALLKGFLEQVFRYDFAFQPLPNGRYEKKLKGISARIVVTMGMPVLAYRWYFGAHSLRNLERNILRFSGIGPVRESLFGRVEDAGQRRRDRWLRRMEKLGRSGT